MGSVYSTQLIDIYIIIRICLENIASVSLECPGRYCLLFVSGRSTGNNSQVIVQQMCWAFMQNRTDI